MQWHPAALSFYFVLGMEIPITCVTPTPRRNKTSGRRIMQNARAPAENALVAILISRNRAACSTPRFAEYFSLFDR
jgi:hypothetical protein